VHRVESLSWENWRARLGDVLTQGNPKGRINAEPSACNGRKCALADNAEKQFVSHFLPVLQMLLPEKQSLPTGGARVCLATKSRKDKA